MQNTSPYILSIEQADGKLRQHGYHLGTDLGLAKKIAVERFDAENAMSVALIRKGERTRYFDFRREWSA